MPNAVKLIFPDISPRVKMEGEVKYIWDSLRRKWLVLTPEEWVRRHVIGWLVSVKRVPALRISQEYPVSINGMAQRADIVVVDERAQPFILVECKAADVAIDEKVLDQARRYNAVVGARYLIITNGRQIYCYEHSNGLYRVVSSL
jgi:predicted type IV restriction endonuclease